MRTKSQASASKVVKGIRRKTRKQHSAEEKIKQQISAKRRLIHQN